MKVLGIVYERIAPPETIDLAVVYETSLVSMQALASDGSYPGASREDEPRDQALRERAKHKVLETEWGWRWAEGRRARREGDSAARARAEAHFSGLIGLEPRRIAYLDHHLSHAYSVVPNVREWGRALVFTRSRAGIGTGFAALALASFALVWNAGSVHVRVILGIVALAAIGLAAYIGLTPVLERFSPEQLALSYEGRMRIASGTLQGALEFLPLGSGLGTFADVFPRYQLASFPGFIDHAHNDYAEAFLELGVAAVAAIAFLAAAYATRVRALLHARLSRSLGYLQLGAGIAMLAMAAHGLFDFNFHIPANALYFSFLAGVLFFTPAGDPA